MTRASVAPPSSSATGRVGRRLVPGGVIAHFAQRTMLAAAARIRVGRLSVVLPDGSQSVFGDPASPDAGEIHVHDSAAVVRLLLGGEIGAGEAYMDGMWSSPDLTALLRVAALNREALALSAGWWRWPHGSRRPWATDCDETRWRAVAATSRPTTTSATTSIGSSSTRA